MSERYLAILLALTLFTTGCIGLVGSGDEAASPSSTGEAGAGAESETAPEPIEREYEGAALVGVPLLDPNGATGVKADFIKASYENGLNGTWLLGYEVTVPEGYGTLEVDTAASGSPDYDLFVFDPNGNVAAQSLNADSDEAATIDDAEPGTYLVAVYLFAGADAPVTTSVAIR